MADRPNNDPTATSEESSSSEHTSAHTDGSPASSSFPSQVEQARPIIPFAQLISSRREHTDTTIQPNVDAEAEIVPGTDALLTTPPSSTSRPLHARNAISRHSLPSEAGSTLDAWWQRLLRGRTRWWYWGGPIGVTILGAILRFWNLGYPHVLMFDETYYVKDAYTLSQLGYEVNWPKEPDPAFVAGHIHTYLSSGEFVAHPPLGKWIIAAGMYLTGGPESSFAWRFSTALLGTLSIFLVALIARRLFKSTFAATLAGLLMAINGVAIALSRTALLDGIVAFFVLAGFLTALYDRDWHRKRLLARVNAESNFGVTSLGGPVVIWRPWLLATGALLGAASAVKWSGIYALAIVGLYVIVDDMLARRQAGFRDGWPTGAILKQGPLSFLTLVPVAVAVYIASWTGWLVTRGGWGRFAAPEQSIWWWIPRSLRSLWMYQEQMYGFSITLSTPHAWASNALQWIPMIRPTLFYRVIDNGGTGHCGADECIATVSSIDNPILWWSAWLSVLMLVFWFIKWRDWRIGFILTGLLATYAPWLLYLHRTVFFSYSVIFVPFLMLALTYVLNEVWGSRTDPRGTRTVRQIAVGTYTLVVVVISGFFLPLWMGSSVPYWFWALHSWLPQTWQ